MSNRPINLYSDTQTLPTKAMRRAMAEAEVGDEQLGQDPTVNRLCETVADLLGKEAALFLPSGTMCNEIAILLHCRPGDEIIADRTAHIVNFEGGGPAVLAGAMIRQLDGRGGVYSAEQVAEALRPVNRYMPRSRLAAVEQTANLGGGTVWPLDALRAVAEVARAGGLALHMDGARLMNAVVASGVPAHDFAANVDTAWIDLSKGLGCPVGAVLAGPKDLIDAAWWWKQRLGGAMRQAGIIAAAGIYALDNHVDRLAEDHAIAKLFAELMTGHPALKLTPDGVDTNIVFLDYRADRHAAGHVAARAFEKGLRIGATTPTRFRALTHIDVNADDVRTAADIFRATLDEFS